MSDMVNNATNQQTLSQSQRATLAIWQQVNASLPAYNKLVKAFFNAESAWQASVSDWGELGLHAKHIERHINKDKTDELLIEVDTALAKGQYRLIFLGDKGFPSQLSELFDPPPLLFVKGNIDRLSQAQVAIVGSRKPTPHAQKITFDMAQYIAQSGYVVTSGLAQGVDYHAHIGALAQEVATIKGRTVGVMGTGINVAYPSHHRSLFSQIIDDGGCLISELLPNMPANKHTFPRRNRIVAGLSLGTIVTEARVKSGSLITARLTSEQGKQVFAVPSHIDNKNAEGCHHLIREGATLIYHPNQVIEDLRYQQMQPIIMMDTHQSQAIDEMENNTRNENQRAIECDTAVPESDSVATPVSSSTPTSTASLPLPNTQVPNHLSDLFAQIDWTGVDVDTLITKLSQDTQTVLSQLMELELMGLIMEQGGRYVRV